LVGDRKNLKILLDHNHDNADAKTEIKVGKIEEGREEGNETCTPLARDGLVVPTERRISS
jgi:hypothetical protein